MSDRTKIVGGIAAFLVLLLFPLWYNLAMGKAGYRPDPVAPKTGKCVMDTEYMRTRHMELLNTWRDDYVRRGDTMHKAPDGKEYVKSLSNTCLGCHDNKAEFCERCHNYAGVNPYCWDCHVVPKKGR